MAVVKVTSQTKNPSLAKATIRYIMHRREQDGQRITRDLFGKERDHTRYEAYEKIDDAPKGMNYIRLTISPSKKSEDTKHDLDFRQLTRATLLALQQQFPIQDLHFFASIHEHTENRHVNILLLLNGRINTRQLKLLREAATANAQEQRSDLDQEQFPYAAVQETSRQRAALFAGSSAETEGSDTDGYGPPDDPGCPACRAPMERQGGEYRCDNCGLAVDAGDGPGREIHYYNGLELAMEEVGQL